MSSIEERLTSIEIQLAQFKRAVRSLRLNCNWITLVSGTFKDDPEFDEVLRLGKELRDADRD
jgi:hypothetical protein